MVLVHVQRSFDALARHGTDLRAPIGIDRPGAEVALSWDPVPDASGYAVFETGDRTELRAACRLPPVTACRPATAEPLVLYSVVGLCADGSPGLP